MLGRELTFCETGPDETTGAYANAGHLLPWQTNATIYFAVFGGVIPDGLVTDGPMLKSTKFDFVSRLVKFNSEQKYLPYTMRVCANKYSLPKGKPPTYAREWLNATKLASPSTCYLASRASSIPSYKTPTYLTLTHADMDPSPTLYLIPKMVRGSCVEPWRTSTRDKMYLPISWVLPSQACPNGLYGRTMQCPKDLRAMEWFHMNNQNASAWIPKLPASPIAEKLANFTTWLVDDFCPKSLSSVI